MPHHDAPVTLGLNTRPAVVRAAAVPVAEELQFDHAIPADGNAAPEPITALCITCKTPIADQYFHAQGQVVCPGCAIRIAAKQQAPPAMSLGRAALYGAGAAFAGFLIYALVAIVLDAQIGFISILVGTMVGKAVRRGSGGRGGRHQQILAIALTYFAVTTSYIPVAIYHAVNKPKPTAQSDVTGSSRPGAADVPAPPKKAAPISFGAAFLVLTGLALAAPFLSLSSGFSGVLTIVIILFGLRQAWTLTGRTDLLVTGPYTASEP